MRHCVGGNIETSTNTYTHGTRQRDVKAATTGYMRKV